MCRMERMGDGMGRIHETQERATQTCPCILASSEVDTSEIQCLL